MLLRRRTPAIASQSGTTAEGYEHLSVKSVAVLRWLRASEIEFVLVGPVASAIRGERSSSGPVAIVPAPYRRNFARLARALWAAHARLRVEGEDEPTPLKLTEDKLAGGARWTVRCGVHDLDIEGHVVGAPSYQELLYEAGRFELADDLAVDVAAPEDLVHYAHVRRTGRAPEMRVTRVPNAESAEAPAAPAVVEPPDASADPES